MDTEDRIDRLEDRLRAVLTLLVNAPIDCTTIPSDSGGAFQGNDWFIGTDLRDEASSLLANWGKEDDLATTPEVAP